MELTKSSAIVTGGASGLGEATVRRLAMSGTRVIIADINQDAGQALAKELGPVAHFVGTDVTDEAAITETVRTAIELNGSLQIVVNCAGIAIAESILGKKGRHDLQRFSRVVQINLIGTFTMLMAAAEVMAHNPPNEHGERGVIINTASIAALEGQIGQAAYASSKAAVVGLTLPAARELARHGIRVMTIAPGLFETPMMAGLPEEARLSLGKQVPFPSRLGLPAEYAALATHIIENVMLNGEIIRLDGALRMSPR